MNRASVSGLIIDTGASLVSIDGDKARPLGIYTPGYLITVNTASGKAVSYKTSIDTISINGAEAQNVEAVVRPGKYPKHILIGMSYLNNFNIQIKYSVLFLRFE